MTPPVVAPVEVIIEAVQFTPGRDAMLLQVAAKDPTHPLLGASRQIPTTQRKAASTPDAALDTVDWSDAECIETVVNYFAAIGVSVAVVPNEEPQPPKGVTKQESIVPKEEEPVDVPVVPAETNGIVLVEAKP